MPGHDFDPVRRKIFPPSAIVQLGLKFVECLRLIVLQEHGEHDVVALDIVHPVVLILMIPACQLRKTNTSGGIQAIG